MGRQPAVYILASKYNGTLYIGVTNDLVRRVWEHKNNVAPGFTQNYQVHRLVYYECYEEIFDAISSRVDRAQRNPPIRDVVSGFRCALPTLRTLTINVNRQKCSTI